MGPVVGPEVLNHMGQLAANSAELRQSPHSGVSLLQTCCPNRHRGAWPLAIQKYPHGIGQQLPQRLSVQEFLEKDAQDSPVVLPERFLHSGGRVPPGAEVLIQVDPPEGLLAEAATTAVRIEKDGRNLPSVLQTQEFDGRSHALGNAGRHLGPEAAQAVFGPTYGGIVVGSDFAVQLSDSGMNGPFLGVVDPRTRQGWPTCAPAWDCSCGRRQPDARPPRGTSAWPAVRARRISRPQSRVPPPCRDRRP